MHVQSKRICCVLFVLVVFAPLGCGTVDEETTGQTSHAVVGPQQIQLPIAVQADDYYRTVTGERAYQQIAADSQVAAAELAEAVAESEATSGEALAVGDVRLLYADGWQDFTLRAIGGNAEIWVANDLSYCYGDDPRPPQVVTQEQVDYLFGQLNDVIYPSNTNFFGYTEDRDGTTGAFAAAGYDWYITDNPQRVMVLVFNIVDELYCNPDYEFYTAGYYWATMNEELADRNIIHIDGHDWANRIGPDAAVPHLYEQVFTHEYEHAIHYDHDADEASWIDEGHADLAPFLAGYGHSAGHLAYYLVFHRTSLTVWGQTLEDYGASYLFQLYLLENFGGPEFIRALIDEQANGIEGIENQLAAHGYDVTFDDIYRDWNMANFLDDTSIRGGSGASLGYDALEIPSADTWGYDIQWSIDNMYVVNTDEELALPHFTGGIMGRNVNHPTDITPPYAPAYYQYTGFEPELVTEFRGDARGGVAPLTGEYELWGGRGDLIFHTATLAEPFEVSEGAELRFWTNYEIESGWDFAFVQISSDGGETWTSLANGDTTSDHDPAAHPDVLANLPGLTGSSGGWVEEVFDLSAYLGETVQVRFAYVTDWGYTEIGIYVDDITIADPAGAILSDGLEEGSDAWLLEGFERTLGLVTCDWEVNFINPIYKRDRFFRYDFEQAVMIDEEDRFRATTTLDTSKLNGDRVTVIVNNRLPEQMSLGATYVISPEEAGTSPVNDGAIGKNR